MPYIPTAEHYGGPPNPSTRLSTGQDLAPLLTILEQATDNFILLDIKPSHRSQGCGARALDFELVSVNHAGRSLLNHSTFPLSCLLRNNLPAFLSQEIKPHLHQCLEKKQPLLCQISQNTNTIQIYLHPFKNAQNQIDCIIALCKKIKSNHEPENIPAQEISKKHTQLIDGIPAIAFTRNNFLGWPLTQLSEGCHDLSGYSSQELLGETATNPYNQLIYPEDLTHVLQTIEQATSKQQSYVIEYRIITKNDHKKWVWEKGIGVYDDKGKLLFLEGFITDISERKQIEEDLKASAELLETMTEAIGIWDEAGIFSYTNPAFNQIFGYEPGELIGQHISLLANQMQETQPKTGAFHLIPSPPIEHSLKRRKDGVLLTTSLNLTPLKIRDKKHTCCFCQDITEYPPSQTLDQQLSKASVNELEKYRSIFENAVEGIFQTTPDGSYITANPMLAQIYGYDSPAELARNISNIQQQLYVDPNRRLEFTRILQQQDAVWEFESEIYRKDGSKIWISENARALRNHEGQLLGYEGTVIDITRRKQAETELLKRDNLLEAVAKAMTYLLTETNHRTAVINALATLGEAAGVDRVYICENHPHPNTAEMASSLRFEWHQPHLAPSLHQPKCHNVSYQSMGLEKLYHTLKNGDPISGNLTDGCAVLQRLLHNQEIASVLWVPILLNNEFWGYIGFDDCQNIRPWSKSEQSILVAIAGSIGSALQRNRTLATIRHQAFHDRLTGLPNRQHLDAQLPLALKTATESGHPLALMFLDLDRFKKINDTLGHPIGDQLLQCAAQRLRDCVREQDIIVRWGGDEFITLLPIVQTATDAYQIAQRILEALRPPFDIENHRLYITSSIGIALYPQDGTDSETLIKNADIALYRAKEEGRNNYQVYNPTMDLKEEEIWQC